MYVCVWWYIREVHCVQFTVHNINTAWANINIFLPLLLMCTYEVCSFESVSFGGSKSVIVKIFSVYPVMLIQSYL